MIHGPCGPLNPQCKCMQVIQGGETHLTLCGKNYPRSLLQHTQTGNDDYPLYRRRSPEQGGFSTQFEVRDQSINHS